VVKGKRQVDRNEPKIWIESTDLATRERKIATLFDSWDTGPGQIARS